MPDRPIESGSRAARQPGYTRNQHSGGQDQV